MLRLSYNAAAISLPYRTFYFALYVVETAARTLHNKYVT